MNLVPFEAAGASWCRRQLNLGSRLAEGQERLLLEPVKTDEQNFGHSVKLSPSPAVLES